MTCFQELDRRVHASCKRALWACASAGDSLWPAFAFQENRHHWQLMVLRKQTKGIPRHKHPMKEAVLCVVELSSGAAQSADGLSVARCPPAPLPRRLLRPNVTGFALGALQAPSHQGLARVQGRPAERKDFFAMWVCGGEERMHRRRRSRRAAHKGGRAAHKGGASRRANRV